MDREGREEKERESKFGRMDKEGKERESKFGHMDREGREERKEREQGDKREGERTLPRSPDSVWIKSFASLLTHT